MRSVLLDPATNVATLFSAPGTKRYQIYEAIMVTQEPNFRFNCFYMNTVTDATTRIMPNSFGQFPTEGWEPLPIGREATN